MDDGSTADVIGSTLYFKQADTDTSGGAVPRTQNSWIKQVRWYVAVAPVHTISNLKFYWSTPTPLTGIDAKGKISLTYTDPTVQAATALTGVTSMYTYTSAAPLSLDGSFTVGTDTAPKFIGGFLQLQLVVAGGASVAANVVLGSLIGRYDES